MYTDGIKPVGKVTCATGNLIDSVAAALAYAWRRRSDGGLATPAEVAAEWRAIKAANLHWYRGRPARPLYLDDAEIERVFFARLDSNERYLARRWANWDQWPADAQLGAHSCAWAAGAEWEAPMFDAAVAGLGFRACAGMAGADPNDPTHRGHAWLRDTRPEDDAAGNHNPTLNPGLRPRNVANQWLFQNAAVVLADGYDPDKLYWPTTLDG